MKSIRNFILAGALLVSNFAFSQGTETRTVGSFTRLTLDGALDVYLDKGNTESVKIVSENIELSKILTEQKDGNLHIYIKREENENKSIRDLLKGGVRQFTRVKVYITYKMIDKLSRNGSGNLTCNSELTASSITSTGSGNINLKGTLKAPQIVLSVSGSGNANIADIESDDLKLSVTGSGNMRVSSGTVKKQTVSVGGSGGIDAYGIKSEASTVSVAGSGSANVTANSTLEGSVSGSGSIHYRGDAKVTKNAVAGSGRIRKQS